jgi:hypothetical protein
LLEQRRRISRLLHVSRLLGIGPMNMLLLTLNHQRFPPLHMSEGSSPDSELFAKSISIKYEKLANPRGNLIVCSIKAVGLLCL